MILKNLEKESNAFKARNGVDPIINFYRKVSESVSLINFVESKTKSRLVKLNARKNYVMNLATAAEVYFKDLIKVLPEFKKIKSNSNEISDLLKEQITIMDAFSLFKRRYLGKSLRIGDIIAIHNKFENLEKIDSVFSKILGLKFLDEIEQHEHKLSRKETKFFTVDTLHLKVNLPDWRNQVGRLFDKRHEIIHQVSFKDNLSYKEISVFWWRLVCFIYSVDFFIRDKYLNTPIAITGKNKQ